MKTVNNQEINHLRSEIDRGIKHLMLEISYDSGSEVRQWKTATDNMVVKELEAECRVANFDQIRTRLKLHTPCS